MALSNNALTIQGVGSTARLPHTLRRLWRMPAREIAHRTWSEAAKWRERLAFGGPALDDRAWLRVHAPALASPGAALALFRTQLPERFFAGAADASIAAAIEQRFPDSRPQVIAAAERALAGRFDLLGYKGLSFGSPIDWHLDPLSFRRAPFAHWSRLDPLDASLVGDSKVVWELNRHQWLLTLAQAWRYTGDERYARACAAAIDDWRRANPVGAGINWASSLEVGYRLIAWCWVAVLLRDSRAVSADWALGLLAAIGRHAAHVRRHLSYYYSPNTHLTGEALALFYAGVLLPQFRAAADWRATGERILSEAARTQVTDDGVHFEQATCYHAYTIEIFVHWLLLARRNGLPVPPAVPARLEQMVEYLMAIRWPDGSIPSIGDDDGGRVLPLAGRPPQDRRELLALAAVVLGRREFAWAADGGAPEVQWLVGQPGAEAFDALRPEPPSGGSRLFSPGGYAVMRSGWHAAANQLIVDTGPLGCPTSSGHGHADLLSVQCAVAGHPFLIDAGTYCYTADRQWRDFFRSTSAHSAVRIDGVDQALPTGHFQWRGRPHASLRAWHSDELLDLLDADHEAYVELTDPVRCRRRVAFVKPHYWVLIDDLHGGATHQVEVAFQCAPNVLAAVRPSGWTRLGVKGGAALWIRSIHPGLVEPRLEHGLEEPPRGWASAGYGQREPATRVVYASSQALPCRIVTVLFADSGGRQSPPQVDAIVDRESRLVGLLFPPPLSSIRFDDETVTRLNGSSPSTQPGR
jgi:hypothetical protein